MGANDDINVFHRFAIRSVFIQQFGASVGSAVIDSHVIVFTCSTFLAGAIRKDGARQTYAVALRSSQHKGAVAIETIIRLAYDAAIGGGGTTVVIHFYRLYARGEDSPLGTRYRQVNRREVLLVVAERRCDSDSRGRHGECGGIAPNVPRHGYRFIVAVVSNADASEYVTLGRRSGQGDHIVQHSLCYRGFTNAGSHAVAIIRSANMNIVRLVGADDSHRQIEIIIK